MPDIVISEFMDEEAVRQGLSGFDVLYDPGLVDQPARLIGLVAAARALVVRNRTQVRGALLDAAGRLRVVGRLGVGLDNIDVDACKARKIAVLPASGANDLSVAEYVICTAMMLLRRAYGATSSVAEGAWPRSALIGREAFGKVLGLVGFGAIAQRTAQIAVGLGMRVAAHDPFAPESVFAEQRVERRELSELFAVADVVSLHVPLTADTRGLINAEALTRMRIGAILINAARGGVVDEAAVVAALRVGKLGGAALDVFAQEPMDSAQGSAFADVPGLILTPHIAGVTEESNTRVSWTTVDNVKKALST
ncbi:hydroxyacid dehydrogenase [Bradyrhizobium mercantei]|uniref:hydroxyacid dehydrogenase n=1 Tax=Bradyrhizobium mercantei TaxID=1904807 RepID=UPI00097857CC|nr:hydroxyacid dehydrogenase [Bradyrhizobium mercantei]